MTKSVANSFRAGINPCSSFGRHFPNRGIASRRLKPKLRAGAQVSRQFYRGDRWYVVRDPAGNQFHRLSDAAYRFVGLLDGRRSVEQAWDLVGGQLADDAPTQPEVIQVLSQLYAANLLETNITPDAMVLLRRHKKLVQQKMQNRLMNVLFPRIRLWDPDRFLCRWMPVARLLFSKLGAMIWLVVVGLALATVLPQWDELKAAASQQPRFPAQLRKSLSALRNIRRHQTDPRTGPRLRLPAFWR